jgi:hypothetical protein
MKALSAKTRKDNRERGATLFIAAASLLAVLSMAGLAIDLVALYVGRSEAQRAADAAALAGASAFVSTGCASGGIDCLSSSVEALATQKATATGAQNLVGGKAPSVPTVSITFSRGDGATPTRDPMITVVASATMPTFFMKIWGVTSNTVSATATAEAYNPSGSTSGPPYCASCLKPFIVPNCDPNHPVAKSNANANLNCPIAGTSNYASYFINPNNNGLLVNSGSVIGEQWTLHSQGAPSQYYSVAVGNSQSKSTYQAAIQGCSTIVITCGTQLQTLNGNAVGPTGQGVEALIHANGSGPGQGQDTINTNTSPFTISAGTNNPYVSGGTSITQSDSLVTVPVYDGTSLSPGGSTATVVGYIQMFIQSTGAPSDAAAINAVVTGVSSCGATSGGTCGAAGSVTGGGGTYIPVRLVHP